MLQYQINQDLVDSDRLLRKKLLMNYLYPNKSNLNSKEYIEKIAREKLDMYTENERVYVDINK